MGEEEDKVKVQSDVGTTQEGPGDGNKRLYTTNAWGRDKT